MADVRGGVSFSIEGNEDYLPTELSLGVHAKGFLKYTLR